MAIDVIAAKPYLAQLRKLDEDATYSAQSYFEAAKSAEIWGRAIVFVPAVLAAVAALIVALGGAKEFGAAGAVAGAVAATASFLGTDRKASSFKDSARQFTRLRHRASLELDLAERSDGEASLNAVVRALRKEYEDVVSVGEPVPGRAFRKAQKRIGAGVLTYSDVESSSSS
jgi:hypothetical protein